MWRNSKFEKRRHTEDDTNEKVEQKELGNALPNHEVYDRYWALQQSHVCLVCKLGPGTIHWQQVHQQAGTPAGSVKQHRTARFCWGCRPIPTVSLAA